MNDGPNGADRVADVIDFAAKSGRGRKGRRKGGNGHDGPPPGDHGATDKGPTAREKLLIAAETAELWRDDDFAAFATVPVNGHQEHWPVRSSGFRRWLINRFAQLFPAMVDGQPRPSAPSGGALQEALLALEARAGVGPVYSPAVRVAGDHERIWLDLGRDDWSAVEVTARGWQLVARCPAKLMRPRGLRALPLPERGGSLVDLGVLMGLPTQARGEEGDAFKLFVGWCLGVLNPRGPYAVLLISGEQGAGKSSALTFAKRLVDPGLAERRGAPGDERDLVIAAKGSRIVSFDNLSKIEAEMSDSIARLSTGAALGARALYTDDEEHLVSVQAPVVANGIPDLASRPDLADRAITIHLARRDDGTRRSEAELLADFAGLHPGLLGALLDAAVAAMANRAEVTRLIRSREQPRMLDFAIWVEAGAPAFGWDRWAWLDAYQRNRREAVQVSIEADAVASAVRALAEKSPFTGTTQELLQRLAREVDERTLKDRAWPKDVTRLSGRMRRAAPGLRRLGLRIEEGLDPTTRRRTWTIKGPGQS